MLEFIQLIKQRYQTVLLQMAKTHPQYSVYQQRVEQLHYAEAFIRKGELITHSPHFPLQITVIGPTQAGKSSIVNLLLDDTSASVSPLAGYTVHPHGYCHGLSSDDCYGMQNYFGRYQCLDESMLSRNRLDCYSLANIAKTSTLIPACVCWDTPDFDSIDSNDYREGVIRTIALADIIILVVSKEKYADQSVWQVMQTIAGFQQPTLICVNKLNEGNEAQIIASLRQKWQQHRRDAIPEIVPLLFQKTDAKPHWSSQHQNAVFKLAANINHKKHKHQQHNWLQQHWQDWLAPIRAEHQALATWRLWVDQCFVEAGSAYRRDFLDHPHHNDTFQIALVNLLTLLEIPGFAKVLSKTRQAMTWPVRKLISLSKGQQRKIGQEDLILKLSGEHVMIQLMDKLLDMNSQTSTPMVFWQETAQLLRQKKSAIIYDYNVAVDSYQLNFQQDVAAAAQRLYHKLQEQPLILNSLRATRATTDAAGLLLALQTGGIGLHDLVLAPVMLTITSLLTESALGHYMHKIEAELKLSQWQTVNQQVFTDGLKKRLYQLPHSIHSANSFAISEADCLQAETWLKANKPGLRLL